MIPRFYKACVLGAAILLSGCLRYEVYPELKDKTLMDKTFSVAELHSDLDFMVNRYKTRHPDWQGRVSEKELDRVHRELRARIDKPMGRRAYFKIVGRLTATLRDGHSSILFPYPELDRYLSQGGRLFPLELTLDDNLSGYVDHTLQDVPQGAKILTINGHAFESLIRDMSAYARGESFSLRVSIINQGLARWLWHIYDIGDQLEVEFSHNGQTKKVTLQGMDKAEVDRRAEAEDEGDLSYNKLDNKTAYVNIGYFGIAQDRFETFVDDTFDSIAQQGIKNLIVDVRKNPGGSTDNVEYLMQYLVQKDCDLVSKVQEKTASGGLEDVNVNTTVEPSGSKRHFNGNFYLLMGKYTYSAATVMATAVKDCKVGTIVGQETGGFANQTGQIDFFDLPATQLRAFIPLRLLIRPSGDRRVEPVIPDVAVVEDQPGVVDKTLERTKAIIASTRKI